MREHTERTPLERETAATLKLVLMEMEQLALLPPVQAVEPIAFNQRRQRVMRKLWALVKLAVRTGETRPVSLATDGPEYIEIGRVVSDGPPGRRRA